MMSQPARGGGSPNGEPTAHGNPAYDALSLFSIGAGAKAGATPPLHPAFTGKAGIGMIANAMKELEKGQAEVEKEGGRGGGAEASEDNTLAKETTVTAKEVQENAGTSESPAKETTVAMGKGKEGGEKSGGNTHTN